MNRAKEEAKEEMLELRLKLKEVEASLESRKEGLEEAEEAWRRRLEEQLDVVEQLQQANFNKQALPPSPQRPVDFFQLGHELLT